MCHSLQLAVHAIGDRALDEVLDALVAAAQLNTNRTMERRHRVEHVQHMSGPATAPAMAAAGAVAVVNPLHLLSDGAMMLQRLGPKRSAAGHGFAYGTLQQVSQVGTL